MKQKWNLLEIVTSPSFSRTLRAFAASFYVPSSWIFSVAINGELAGRLRYGCKHKSNSGQPSSEDPQCKWTQQLLILQKFLSKLLVYMALAVENWRKTILSIADDCCRQHATSFPWHFSLTLEVGLSPPPKPRKSALETRLDNIVSVNIACVAGAWKYLGAEKNRRAKGRHARVERNTCLPRGRRSLFSPLFPSACYAGYIEQQ